MSTLKTIARLFTALAFAVTASAQVPLTSSTYTQDFNTLPTSGDINPFVDNSTLTGWYASYAAQGTSVPAIILSAGTGGSATARLWNYGAALTNPLTDRAFGALTSANAATGTGVVTIALRLQNNTGQTIDTVNVGYTGEHWRTAGAVTRTMSFGYSLVATGPVTGTYTPVAGNPLNFTSPAPSATASALDGNLAANRVVFAPTSLSATALGWTAGSDLWIRWVIPTTGSAQGLSIDDLTVTAVLAPIPAPTDLVATPGAGQVGLSWTASAGAATYSIKRSTTTGGPYTTLSSGSVTGTTFADTTGTASVPYFYVVTAVSAAAVESANSNEVTAAAEAAAPAAPTGLVANPGPGQVGLSWTASAGAATYSIKRSTTTGGTYTTLSSGTVTGTTFTDTTGTVGVPYFYVVTAVSAAALESANSNEVTAASQAAAPAAPTALVATAGVSQIGLSWTASAGAATYSIKRSTTSGSGYTTLSSGSVTGTTYTDTSVVNGTAYFYVVSAVSSGESPDSAEVSATAITAVQGWRQLKFGSAANTGSGADNADPDADGRSNLIEYATGTEPLTADSGPAATLGQSSAPAKLTLAFNRIADPALTYTVRASNDLNASWSTSGTTIFTSTGGANIAGSVTAEDTALISAQARRFLRLEVSY